MPKIRDIAGQKFDKLTAIRRLSTSGDAGYYWLCHCDCGVELEVQTGQLTRGKKKSCGCGIGERAVVDLIGQRFGRFLVLKLVSRKSGGVKWECLCDCGVTKIVKATNLKNSTSSCGCLRREINTTHSMSSTSTYCSYVSMLVRTSSEKHSEYYTDVEVDDRWLSGEDSLSGFQCFLLDMGKRPEGKTLNRKQQSKIYSKETCEWATLSVQSYDKKRSVNNTSGKTGVLWVERKRKWKATITKNYKKYHLGYFDMFEAAVAARIEGEIKYYGFTKE